MNLALFKDVDLVALKAFGDTVGDLTLDALTEDHVVKALSIIKQPAKPALVQGFLMLARGDNPASRIRDWALAKFQDGSLNKVLQRPSSLFHRCTFCHQPSDIKIEGSLQPGDTFFHRCPFCKQPNAITV